MMDQADTQVKNDSIGLENVSRYLGKPKLFVSDTSPFWDDPHISEQMLVAHLDPNRDVARRKYKTIDE